MTRASLTAQCSQLAFFAGVEKHWTLFEELHFSVDAYNAAFQRELPAYDVRDRVEVGIKTLPIDGG